MAGVVEELASRAGGVGKLASTDEGHFGGHDCHEEHVGFQGEAGHVDDGVGDVFYVEGRLGFDGEVGLEGAVGHGGGELGSGVADVDLTARDVVRAALERGGFGEACDSVF